PERIIEAVNPIFLFLELAATGIFVAAAVAALRRGRLPFLELLSAAAFGLLLEEGSQLIFQTYHYSPQWSLVLDRAPLVIGLTWALLIAGAMRITDALGVRRWTAPFVDAVLVIMLDLAFDAIAIRMGMWTWVDIGPSDGWFGVQAGNFYTWLFITFGFSLLTRWLRDRAARRRWTEWLQLLVPLPAYLILVGAIIPYALISAWTDAPTGGALWLSALFIAMFSIVAWRGVFGSLRQSPNGQHVAIVDLRLAFLTRLSIQAFFLIALLVMGLATRLPMLLVTSVSLLAADVWLSRLVEQRRAAAVQAATLPRALAAAPAPIREP
ncbi:MAG: carotenoid biosynthesis protein, partial [Candidatus Limnocylindria bacterium]